ncbi:hypothetical protein Krac_8530 [Ktedonobacter racemifer DSM 44963]|uniref:Uncharacterized protein n=1 Tax=Ktedonobacter racemifer DSM 44963 TaxID=485913 RepID=D6TN52_KTERA|nr:hypothetical protein Krac_8530 [Ktedonobacter racemifer DSM 44963]
MYRQPGGYYTPPPPPPPKSSFINRMSSWYKRQRRGSKIGIGCLALVMVFLLCTCSLAAIGGNQASPSTNQVAAASTPQSQATAKPTQAKPTQAKPTPTPTPSPTPSPTPQPPTPTPQPPPPTPTPQPAAPATGVNGNPWGYNFNPGNVIYSPPGAFCSYFSCISSFWSGGGYVMECNDGMYGKSGGISGSCSHHGGNMRPLYSH